MRHTPGPWYLATGCSWRRFLSANPLHRDEPVCVPTNHPKDNWPDLIVKEADARLIAAAPDLLCAAKCFTEYYRKCMNADPVEHTHNLKVVAADLEAAIAKAEAP